MNEALAKLVATLAKFGIRRFGSAEKILKDGRAQNTIDREKKLIDAATEKDIAKINKGELDIVCTDKGIKLVSTQGIIDDSDTRIEPTINTLVNNSLTNMVAIQLQKDCNVEESIRIAESVLANDDDKPSDKPIDQDWLFKWREYAGMVSSIELQNLWGHVLAGEIKTPHSFSIRTLEFLNAISKEDAELIVKIASFVINDMIFKLDNVEQKLSGLDYVQFLYLQEIGFLQGVDSISNIFAYRLMEEKGLNICKIIIDNKCIFFTHFDKTEFFQCNAIKVSTVGLEILKLIDPKPRLNQEYLYEIAKFISKQGFNVEIQTLDTNSKAVHIEKID